MDVKKSKELEKLVKFCRKTGVTSLKMDGIELTLAPTALFPESKYKQKKTDTTSDNVSETQFSEEETLFWSSTGIPEQPEAQ